MPDIHVQIAIAGAGLSGLGMATALRRDGIEDFVVLERADDLGGTWRDNSYPGCACDIASVLYSYSDEQNPNWTRAFAPQPEIQAYIRDVAALHGVMPHMRFGHEVLAADWDGDADRWRIQTSAGELSAEVLISAVGALADPSIPDLPGLETFAGTVFHSARWNHDHDLSGRRVAVVGTGASAIQFVPEIQPVVDHLALFQRTPPWVLPRGNPVIPGRWRRRFARHPRLMSWMRRSVFSLYESFHYGFKHPAVMRLAERRARAHIERPGSRSPTCR
jgi:cation diffusion facilitator CzcD-associated flavoprotein CzcO